MANIVQIIKYEGDNSTFIWKSPITDFNTGSQLIVHESQEAVFFMNGQALDLFGPGRHTLETQNIPLVRKILNKPTGDQSPFHCEVYFINKVERMAVKWGTDSHVQYMEPAYRFPLKIGASGEMSLRADDSRKLLLKILGTEKTLVQAALTQMFRVFLMARIKPYLAQTMQNSEFCIFQIDSRMGELSEALHKQLVPDFSDYGISLERFFVTNIVKPEGDKAYEKFKDIHIRQYSDVAEAQLRQQVGIIDQQTSAQRMIIESAAIAQKRVQEGYSYQHERAYDVAEKIAQNEGVGNFSNAGIGLGMMGGVAGGMGGMIAGLTTNALNPAMQGDAAPVMGVGLGMAPPAGGQAVPPAPQSPTPAAGAGDGMEAFKQRLEKLKMMKEMGMMSDEEFDAERKKIMGSL
ncbi:MAG: SPFH domain-containing protein [Chitinispirillales bacterium]|nr:SPFH domain-containing protein [Chitinispirillales bacterium]